jgi:hypothetical protein
LRFSIGTASLYLIFKNILLLLIIRGNRACLYKPLFLSVKKARQYLRQADFFRLTNGISRFGIFHAE